MKNIRGALFVLPLSIILLFNSTTSAQAKARTLWVCGSGQAVNYLIIKFNSYEFLSKFDRNNAMSSFKGSREDLKKIETKVLKEKNCFAKIEKQSYTRLYKKISSSGNYKVKKEQYGWSLFSYKEKRIKRDTFLKLSKKYNEYPLKNLASTTQTQKTIKGSVIEICGVDQGYQEIILRRYPNLEKYKKSKTLKDICSKAVDESNNINLYKSLSAYISEKPMGYCECERRIDYKRYNSLTKKYGQSIRFDIVQFAKKEPKKKEKKVVKKEPKKKEKKVVKKEPKKKEKKVAKKGRQIIKDVHDKNLIAPDTWMYFVDVTIGRSSAGEVLKFDSSHFLSNDTNLEMYIFDEKEKQFIYQRSANYGEKEYLRISKKLFEKLSKFKNKSGYIGNVAQSKKYWKKFQAELDRNKHSILEELIEEYVDETKNYILKKDLIAFFDIPINSKLAKKGSKKIGQDWKCRLFGLCGPEEQTQQVAKKIINIYCVENNYSAIRVVIGEKPNCKNSEFKVVKNEYLLLETVYDNLAFHFDLNDPNEIVLFERRVRDIFKITHQDFNKLTKTQQIAKIESTKKTFNIFKREKKEITIKDVLDLGKYTEFNAYPVGMLKEFKTCKKQFCRGKIAGKKVYEIFAKRGELWHQRHPGDIIHGMAWFEIFYLEKLRKNEKQITRYIKNGSEGYSSKMKMRKDVSSLHGLIKTNKGRIKMREALGLSLNDDLETVLKRHWLLGDFLNKDKLKVKKVKINSDIKKRKKLLAEYKSALTRYKNKLDEERRATN